MNLFRGQLHADGLTSVKFVHLDVTDAATIHAAKETIEKAEEKLDVLVNNAGMLQVNQLWNDNLSVSDVATGVANTELNQYPATLLLSTVRGVMEVNFFGAVQTTVTLLPLMRKSTNGGAIVNVTSMMGSNSFQANPTRTFRSSPLYAFSAYSMSKAALNSYTIALSHELKAEGIKVNTVSPGHTATKMSTYNGKTTRAGAEVLLPWVLLEKDGPTGTRPESAVDISGRWYLISTGRFIDHDQTEAPW